jgi:hypothetical protein
VKFNDIDRTNDPYLVFSAAIPFLAKVFRSTDRFTACLWIHRCPINYGFETAVSWSHWSIKILSKWLGESWELSERERLGGRWLRLIYTTTADRRDGGAPASILRFDMGLVFIVGIDGCMGRLVKRCIDPTMRVISSSLGMNIL